MSWTSETNIKGPKGDKGDQGIQGPPGASGAGTGNVTGPAGAVADRIATYNGVSGTVIKDGGKLTQTRVGVAGPTPRGPKSPISPKPSTTGSAHCWSRAPTSP